MTTVVRARPPDPAPDRQTRWFRVGVLLSVAAHVLVLVAGSSLARPGRTAAEPEIVMVEVAAPEPAALVPAPVDGAPDAAPAPKAARSKADARRWLDRVDAGLTRVRAPGRAPWAKGPPERAPASGSAARKDDSAPRTGAKGPVDRLPSLDDLERRVRGASLANVRDAGGEGVSVAFDSADGGADVPAALQDMIRRRVNRYLPELEAAYSAAIRRNPGIRGRIVVRFRIDGAGKVAHAEAVDPSVGDGPFVAAVIDKVRGWTFEAPPGRTVEVVYPFVFVVPS